MFAPTFCFLIYAEFINIFAGHAIPIKAAADKDLVFLMRDGQEDYHGHTSSS